MQFLPKEIGQVEFLLRLVILATASALLAYVLQFQSYASASSSVLVGCAFIYGIAGIFVPRARHAGFSLWLLLLLFVPFVNLFFTVCLLAAPSKKERNA